MNLFFKHKKDLSDEDLMISISSRNPDAFNELYSRYKDRLLYFFYRMLGHDKELAQDFLQEIFIKIIDNPKSFNPKKKFSTWIFSIANNMCKNEYRSQEVRKIIVKEENPDRYCGDTENTHETERLISQIFTLIETLDDSHKSIFLLKYKEGFSVDEISSVLDIPQGTIKSRLYYTRKKLQEQLSNSLTDLN